MTVFNLDDTIPAANNNPSQDQPILLSNNVAIKGIADTDHVGYGQENGGTHKLTSYYSKNASPAILAGDNNTAIMHTQTGTASPKPNYYMDIAGDGAINISFPLSLIRAWASITDANTDPGTNPKVLGITQSDNIVSVTRNSTGVYTVVMKSNVTTGTDYGILITYQSSTELLYRLTVTNATTFVIRFRDNASSPLPTSPTGFTFIVVQK